MDTRIFIHPSLCGCEIKITAEWVESNSPIRDGQGRIVTYQHPKALDSNDHCYISNLEIVNTCALHDHLKSIVPDYHGDFIDGIHPKTGLPYQVRGFLRHATVANTEAENLYTHFFVDHGWNHKSEFCPCIMHNYGKVNQVTGEAISRTYIKHPVHTIKCLVHANDTDDHQNCLAENALYSKVKDALLVHPDMQANTVSEVDIDTGTVTMRFRKGDEPKISFDAKRQIVLDLKNVADPAKVAQDISSTTKASITSK